MVKGFEMQKMEPPKGEIMKFKEPWILMSDRKPEPVELKGFDTAMDSMLLTAYKVGNRWHYGIRIYGEDGDWYNEFGHSTMNISGEREPITHWKPIWEPKE